MPFTWTPEAGKCPKDVDALKITMAALVRVKSGKKLLSDKFTKDHIFAGHSGPVTSLGAQLAKLRELPMSTIMITSMDATAQKEVLNWVTHVPDTALTLNEGTWTVSNRGSAVPATASYKFATVDLDALKGMNRDDIVSKSRKWLKESLKTPHVACVFDTDGTPIIYHLDF
jgi:hypothetical protein